MLTGQVRRRLIAWGAGVALTASQFGLLAATPAHAATTITLSPLATGFNNPIGVDYHEPTNSVLLSVNYSTGQPNNFDLVASNGSHTQFSSVHGLTDEVYMSSVRTSTCQQGFLAGQTFFGTGSAGAIARISPDGSSVQNPWVTLPGEAGLLRGGLFQDRYCAFGGDLIATTTTGDVWRVTSAGVPTLLRAGVGSFLEGPTTVPNIPSKYGPWAGTILVGDESNGCVYSVTAAGGITCYSFGHDPESVRIIPANENFFGVDFSDGTLVGGAASEFSGIVGDVLLANESGYLQHISWNGTSFVAEQVAKIGQFEGTAFAPATIPTALTLTPATATNPVGGSHTVTATVSFAGSPQSGQTVSFQITAGPNAGKTGSGTTNASGQTSFTYSDTGGVGTDTITATWIDRFGGTETATATKTWVKLSTTLTYNGATSSDYNDSATLSATLTDTTSGSPIAGAPVTFSLNAAETCSGTTDASGKASCSVTPGEAAGPYTVTASYAGDATHAASSSSTGFTVTLEETALSSTTALQLFSSGGTATLSSTLTDPDGGAPIAAKAVTMTLGSGSGAQSCTATTDASGTATCTISPVTVALGPQPVTDSFGGDAFYKSATNAQQALVFAFTPGGSFVVGDKSATGAVTFWGAQWSKANTLSGGGAPAAFKGFEDTPAVTACATGWTTDPGNSTPPPAAPLPSYMAVVVASAVSQSGSTISGNTVNIVIVKTDPGYQPNPGHAGTGTVVATFC
jgi:hypothetical protein